MFRNYNDRITEDADWRDGINAFRQAALEEIKLLKEKILKLEKELNNDSI